MSAEALAAFDRTSSQIDADFSRDAPPARTVLPCEVGRVRVRIVVKDDAFAVVRGLKYKLLVADEAFAGTIPPNGVIEHLVREAATRGSLEVTFGADDVYRWDLEITAIDPVDLDTGVATRLHNLALAPSESTRAEDLATGLGAMRDAFHLRERGEISEADRTLLEQLWSAHDTAVVEPAATWSPPPELLAEFNAFRVALGEEAPLPDANEE